MGNLLWQATLVGGFVGGVGGGGGVFVGLAAGEAVVEIVAAAGLPLVAGGGGALMHSVWFGVEGLWLVIGHITTAAAQAVTIIGIPLAIANLKMIPITCFPFGKVVIDDPTASIL